MVAEPRHRLRLALDAQAARLIETRCLDARERDLAIEPLVAGEVDALHAAFAEEPQQRVPATRDRRGHLERRFGNRSDRGVDASAAAGTERGPARKLSLADDAMHGSRILSSLGRCADDYRVTKSERRAADGVKTRR